MAVVSLKRPDFFRHSGNIYRWLGRTDLRATKVKRHKIKLDCQALEKDVKKNPDARLIDRAKKFGVRPSARYYALKKMKITQKKKRTSLPGGKPRIKNEIRRISPRLD